MTFKSRVFILIRRKNSMCVYVLFSKLTYQAMIVMEMTVKMHFLLMYYCSSKSSFTVFGNNKFNVLIDKSLSTFDSKL